jgi:NAD(P)H dehydrogenase (quinone)
MGIVAAALQSHSAGMSILVTGAAGHLGRRVLDLLLAQNAGPIIATTRNPDSLADFAARGVTVRRADFEDAASLAPAFAGATRALLISTDALDRPGRRLAQHQAAVRALAAAGVKHVVYTSLPEAHDTPVSIAPDHAGTEDALAASGLDYTILRNNFYADLLFGILPPALKSGTLVDSRGDGRTAWVTREDCARAAVAALVSPVSGRRTLDVTGPDALTSDELVAIVSELVGRPIAHLSVPQPALIAGMVEHGLPKPVAEIYASFDAAIAQGKLARVSDTVQRLTGRAPQSVADFLRAHRDQLRA